VPGNAFSFTLAALREEKGIASLFKIYFQFFSTTV
jgi:hypothetical protein